MPRFNHQRLVLARERSGILQKELAAVCGVAPQTISNWEAGFTDPPDGIVPRIAAATRFPERFFFMEGLEPPEPGSVTFRARSRIPAKKKRAALAAGALAQELGGWIENHFNLPPVDLPFFESQPSELVAEVLRAEWMLGSKPIPNMIHLLESRGVLVFSLADDVKELDAFSFWSGKRPIVLLNTMKSSERSRTDAAHELFHLVCHREETGKKEEEEATKFAGAFLLPKDDLYKHFRSIVSLHQLIEAKKRWRVSLAALVVRLHELGIIKDWQYRMFYLELSKRGYRTHEPPPLIEREESSALSQVFSLLAKRGMRPRQVAQELGWDRRQLDELIFGLGAAFIPVSGGAAQAISRRTTELRLVNTADEHSVDEGEQE
jgi:Zn-dependent peptidase ImmA (M78 family)/transcriptional regulator with XRE-family HTH domain